MGQANLKVVGGGSVDKQKALEAALGQIERAFGKGSVMKLGSSRPSRSRPFHPAPSAWISRLALVVCRKAA